MDAKDERAARLAAQLRTNLKRRKAQAREALPTVDPDRSADAEIAADVHRGAGSLIRDP